MVPVLSYSESGFSDPYAYFAYYLVSNGLPVCEYIATGGLSGVPMGSGGIAICRSGFHGAGGGEVGQPGVLCEICKGSVGRPGWTVGLGRSWSADSANTELSERCARIKSGASERTVDGTLQDNDSIAEDGSGSCGSRRTGDSDFVRGVPADTTRRGPNWHRNVRKRQRRREKTLRAIADSEFKNQRSAGSGFFSGCDDGLLKDLRESRARMLIAQNNSKTVEATRRIGMIDTSVDVLEKVVKMGELASRAEKMSSVGDVMSWAGRAAISRSETLACQAPPNLVPYRKSASSAGEVTVETKPSVKPKVVKGKHKVRSEKPGFISQPHGRPLDAPGKLVELGVVRPGDTRYDNDPDVIYINRTQWTGSIPGSGDSYEVRVAYRRPARRSMDSKPNGNYGWCLEDVPATKLEQRVLELGILDKTRLVEMRNARARVLGLYDFKSLDFMHITEEVFEELGAIYKAMIT